MRTGNPRHVARARPIVTFDNHGEPASIKVSVEYYVHTPEYGPEFDLSDDARDRLGDVSGHIIDRLYDMAFNEGLGKDDLEDRLSDDGFIAVTHKGTEYRIMDEDVTVTEARYKGTFSDGINATVIFDVDDGTAKPVALDDIDGIYDHPKYDDRVNLKVLRLLPAAIDVVSGVPGIEDVYTADTITQRLINEGFDADRK